MITFPFKVPSEVVLDIARRAKDKRLSLNLSQQSLSSRSGVSYGVLKKFERTGKISLESLLKLALVLDCLPHFDALFAPKGPQEALSLDELMKDNTRKRGRT